MDYKCIIFDCDGVLVDSEPIAHQVIVEMANDLGANITYDYAHQRFSGGFLKQSIDHIATIIPENLPENFEQEYRRITFERFAAEIQAIEGVQELIESLEVPICVASNGPLHKMKLTLSKTGLIHYFKGNIFSAYELQAWKPDPTLFLHAAAEMDCQPSECLVVEDSLSGVTAAIAGGFDVLVLSSQDQAGKFEKMGARVFTSMKAIQEFLSV